LGLAVVGGLLVSQLLTLYITPVYYVYIENARLRMMRRRAAESPHAPGVASRPLPPLADAPPALQRSAEASGRR
jgi:hypothetical protein